MANGGRGRKRNPDVFELNLNHRFGPGTSAEAAQSYVRELVAGEAELEFRTCLPRLRRSARTRSVRLLAESACRGEPKQAWTDLAPLRRSVFPRVNFVPALRRQAHQKNEWTELSLLVVAATSGQLAR